MSIMDWVAANQRLEAPTSMTRGSARHPSSSKIPRWGWRPRQRGSRRRPSSPWAGAILRRAPQARQEMKAVAPRWEVSLMASSGWAALVQWAPSWTHQS